MQALFETKVYQHFLRSQENVSWYFSPPQAVPGAADVTLDRKTSYSNGPIGADLRGLAIGNFNETMHGYGLDRQFRGEIRGLQIFGSRVGGRGAFDLEEIKRHQPYKQAVPHAFGAG